LMRALFCAKWVTSAMSIPPTLRRLLDDAAYRERVVRGEFAAPSLKWSCPDCAADHAPTGECPPACRGCNRHHSPAEYCIKRRQLEQRERAEDDERELSAWVSPDGE